MITPDWLAVLAAGVLMFVLGGLWYSPVLFARAWVPLAHPGKSMEDLQKQGGGGAGYALAFLGGLLSAAIVGVFAEALGGGLLAGLGAGAGVAAVVAAAFSANYVFGGKPLKLYLIDAGYQSLGVLLAGAVYGVWPW